MPATNTVRVLYRHVELAAAASWVDRGEGVGFVHLEAPPPVRTVLTIALPDGNSRAVEVTRASESAAEAERGCEVRVLASEPAREVGSEQLPTPAGRPAPAPAPEPEPEAQGDASAEPRASNEEPGYGSQMAVPAPVVGDDESESIDVAGGDEDDAEGGNGGSEAGNGARGKKRRGRKRR